MRWLLIIIVLGIDLIAFLNIVRAPFNDFYINEISENLNSYEKINKTTKIKRNRRNLIYGQNRWRSGYYSKLITVKNKLKPSHPLRHREKFSFILRCPSVPETPIEKKIGVEWSLNSKIYLRIISNGKKYESGHISKIEEWKTVDGKLNVIAYGPKIDDYRYKFEYEESRGWFALKIKKITENEIGIWKCKIKLKFPNSTILHFESRKTAKIHQLFPENTVKINEIIKNDENIKNIENSKILNYSEPPLFSFSKTGGDYAIFSRVDKRRDLLSYVRTDSYINRTPKFEKRQRFNYCSSSIYSTSFNFLILFLYFIFRV